VPDSLGGDFCSKKIQQPIPTLEQKHTDLTPSKSLPFPPKKKGLPKIKIGYLK